MHVESFPPILGRDASVLVLGSMPGAASLAARQYYAHPRNAFWPIMAALCGFERDAPYAARVKRLEACGVAVWDVLARCVRPGSLDSRIDPATEVPNAIAELLATRPSLTLVALNGGKAHAAFRRHVWPQLDAGLRERLTIVRLPSTSPAHARRSLDAKRDAWRAALAGALRR
jgi:hypoxanthine-DNA glycosylase